MAHGRRPCYRNSCIALASMALRRRSGSAAAAYGVSVEDFAAELAGVNVFEDLRDMAPIDQSDRWSFRAALHGHIPDWLIDELAEEWEGRPVVNQRAAVQGILQMAESQRRRNTSDTLQTRPA